MNGNGASLLPGPLHPPGGFSTCIPRGTEDYRAAALSYLSDDIHPNTCNMRFKYLKKFFSGLCSQDQTNREAPRVSKRIEPLRGDKGYHPSGGIPGDSPLHDNAKDLQAAPATPLPAFEDWGERSHGRKVWPPPPRKAQSLKPRGAFTLPRGRVLILIRSDRDFKSGGSGL